MKLLMLIFLLCFSITHSYSQTEEWNYCFSETSSLLVSRVSETQSGDSTLTVYSEDYSNSQFELLYLQDTIYSKYNGAYYFLGTDSPSVGDIWNPLRYQFMSFQDSSTQCVNLMNLEVMAVNQIQFGGSLVNVVELLDLDLEFNVTYEFIEGIGVTIGGPLYNLKLQYYCDVIFDFTEPVFRSFTRGPDLYEGLLPCPVLSLEELYFSEKHRIKILDVLGRETQERTNELQIHVYSDGTTKRVYSVE